MNFWSLSRLLADGRDAPLPGLRDRWFGRRRPVAGRPFQAVVPRGEREVEDVSLRNSDVLKELPRRMRDSGGRAPRRCTGRSRTASSKETCASDQPRDRARRSRTSGSADTPVLLREPPNLIMPQPCGGELAILVASPCSWQFFLAVILGMGYSMAFCGSHIRTSVARHSAATVN